METIRSKGFTLLELMVTLFIVAIVMAAAVPSFKSLSVRNRLVTYTNDFIATVNIARSEAVRRGSPVTICHSSDGASCGGTWSDGWIAFADADNDGDAGDPDDEPVLRVHERLSTKYTLNPDPAFADRVTFGADGGANATGVFSVCHDGEIEGARAIILSRLRPRVARDDDGNKVPNLAGGNMEQCEEPSS
jgi:type IV fimbrial biogenesis protein FimT